MESTSSDDAQTLRRFDREDGCEIIEHPINKQSGPDTKGSFYDFADNYWVVSTQTNGW